MKHLYRICLLLALAACQREVPVYDDEGGGIRPGEPVLFTTLLPAAPQTKATAEQDAFDARMASYQAVNANYQFTVEMYQQGVDNALGSAIYRFQDPMLVTDGTLLATTPLYWPGNAMKYGFKAIAGTASLEDDQTTGEKILQQDRLLGYGFEPLWNTEGNAPVDNENALNYRTSKEWYAANKQTMGLALESAEYKKIPLYFQHQRSLITIVLKAGEGVNREDLAYEKALSNIQTRIFSYSNANLTVQPLAESTTVDYTSSDYGSTASDVPTTQYSAVVEPHNYQAAATTDVIAEIQLSGQRFTFYADNDSQSADASHMAGYNLTAGKHLTITATLGRGSRKIVITSYVEDWTQTVTTSIVDDYGQTGNPIAINSRKELYDFLSDPTKNKQGNVAIIVPTSINLEQSQGADLAWVPQPLNCTLNMAGATFFTNHTIFTTIGASGNLVNGTVSVGDIAVPAAVATTNNGTIQRIHVQPRDKDGNDSSGEASKAGLVVTNTGTITDCSSELPVNGTAAGFVGGIAASSVYTSEGIMPVIDGCTVNARVDGVSGVQGGGIVGEAVGRVTGNRFEYGITISQSAAAFENIIHSKADATHVLRAYNNAWPTKALNNELTADNVNATPEASRYDAVIDSQAELGTLLLSANNQVGKVYRLSNSFSVTKAGEGGWTHGKKHDTLGGEGDGNVFFQLDGNDKTITTDAMLFSNIQGPVKNLTIRLSANLLAEPSASGDAIAPLGYAVYGAKISNIKVKAGDYRIQASTAGGIVVWAYGGATLENCQCKASVQVWVSTIGADTKMYTGGIAACAAEATFDRCIFHSTEGTLFRNKSENYDDETSVAEATPNTSIFFGGILGGTAPKGTGGSETPSVLITDCSSWFSTLGSHQKGAIVGYAQYAEGEKNFNGIADGCQGNWWNTTSDGIGTGITGKTDEQILGKRNAVAPVQDNDY